MLTIKTKPDCTLGFVDTREMPFEKVWIFNPKDPESMEWNSIGKLSEITEWQAEELVAKEMKYPGLERFKMYYELLGKGAILAKAKYSLYSAALSVGIEEKDFNNYLVIKL